ncbi:hypothetical protein CTRI78_v001027 [Colletotrichum trifolii]|uniref:Uncharacterized protein n=1 Tax=Colletotrichum trifolii TaxID=5466 RepID=A0A4R8RTR1_COLTR|nr:hypothetical protein CTRI78_v001027 [Colletotrichum trifolii]
MLIPIWRRPFPPSSNHFLARTFDIMTRTKDPGAVRSIQGPVTLVQQASAGGGPVEVTSSQAHHRHLLHVPHSASFAKDRRNKRQCCLLRHAGTSMWSAQETKFIATLASAVALGSFFLARGALQSPCLSRPKPRIVFAVTTKLRIGSEAKIGRQHGISHDLPGQRDRLILG